MPSPFNMPDEFVQGLLKSADSFTRAFSGMQAAGEAPGAGTGASRPSLPDLQLRYWQQQTALWMGTLARSMGQSQEPVIAPERGDRRFNADEWRDNPWYSLLEQAYLLNARLLEDTVDAADLSPKEKRKARFFANQFID